MPFFKNGSHILHRVASLKGISKALQFKLNNSWDCKPVLQQPEYEVNFVAANPRYQEYNSFFSIVDWIGKIVNRPTHTRKLDDERPGSGRVVKGKHHHSTKVLEENKKKKCSFEGSSIRQKKPNSNQQRP